MTETITNPTTTNSPICIIDTNIFGNLLDPKTFTETYKILFELSTQYRLYISKITIQEIVAKGTNDVVNTLNTFNSFGQFDITDVILTIAGLLSCVSVKGAFDSIIASTAFLNNAVLLTANHRDFPEPCFQEKQSWTISYKDDGNRTTHQLIFLLLPNITNTVTKINNIDYVKELHKT